MEQLPEMTRGKGVQLIKTKDGVVGARAFHLKDGLSYETGNKIKTLSAAELKDFIGERAQAGRMVPKGFRI